SLPTGTGPPRSDWRLGGTLAPLRRATALASRRTLMPRIGTELSRFLVVGATTVAIDFLSYCLLLWFGVSIAPAKAAGFLVGTVFAYFANSRFTFNVDGSPRRFLSFIALYSINLL